MRTGNDESVNIFTGKWMIVGLYGYVQDQGWTLIEEYKDTCYLWEFEEENRNVFLSGVTSYEGKLKELYNDGTEEITQYSYYPSDRLLYIDRSDYEPDGFCNICLNDRYRVEHLHQNEYRLYDLEDVKNEPEDYRFRIKIKRTLRS